MRLLPSRIVPLALLLSVLSLSVSAFKEGPMPNMTGGFGDPTCQTCHLGNPLNAPGGRLSLSGVPAAFRPAQTYRITVRLEREDLRRGGFEIGARFASGPQAGRQAGTWRTLDRRVQIQPSQDGGLQFAQHTTAGTLAPTHGAVSWTFDWTAPAGMPPPVQFNVAGNAANDDDSPLGDYIYTLERRSAPR